MATQDPDMNKTPVEPPPRSRGEEDSFWRRHSPHHEFPLSLASSVLLHVVVLVVVATLGAVIYRSFTGVTPTLSVVETENPGGNLKPGRGEDTDRVGIVSPEPTPQRPAFPPRIENPEPGLIGPPIVESPDVSKLLEQARRAPTGKDKEGEGDGLGEGPGNEPGKAGPRHARMKRWRIHFEFDSASDYLRQLYDNGATVAIPLDDGRYRMFDAANPKGRIAPPDPTRIWFEHVNSAAVELLGQALGVNEPASKVRIYFSQDMEAKLVEKEKAFWKMAEAEIDANKLITQFNIVRKGSRYDIQVVEGGSK